MVEKNIAICTIAYNEDEWIERCIEQFKPFNLRHLVLVSANPWHGTEFVDNRTPILAREKGATVIIGYWPSEYEQRNYGLAYLYEYDWVLIVDADELYSQEDIATMLKILPSVKESAVRTDYMNTYWKTTDYRFDPRDGHQPIIAVKPKEAQFYEHRQLRLFTDPTPRYFEQYLLHIPMYHMSWVKSDNKVKEKIASFSHADQIKPGWYEDVWLKWTPEMSDIRPYGVETTRAIYDPCPLFDKPT